MASMMTPIFECTSSFAMLFVRCLRTVCALMARRTATSAELSPSASVCRTSSSRALSGWKSGVCALALLWRDPCRRVL